MFDLITGQTRHIPSTPGLPLVVSVSAQLTLVAAIVLLVPKRRPVKHARVRPVGAGVLIRF